MSDGDTSFLSRWSRRKAEARQGQPVEDEPALVPAEPVAVPQPAAQAPLSVEPEPEPAPAQPTLADVALLTRDSDFSRFVAPGTDEAVKQAAMKKLFSDPHFNVMDGLDTYIDDYGKADAIPASMLREMVQSATLGLFDHELDKEQEPAEPNPTRLAEATPPPSPDLIETHDDADLQLQQDDAAGRPCADPGAGP